MWVLQCYDCGAKTAMQRGVHSELGRCPQCGSVSYEFRPSSSMESILIKLHLMKIYK